VGNTVPKSKEVKMLPEESEEEETTAELVDMAISPEPMRD